MIFLLAISIAQKLGFSSTLFTRLSLSRILGPLQALCFNLFYPLISSARIAGFFRLLPGDFVSCPEYDLDFEKVLDDGTNVDFYFEEKNVRHLFEIKYTESNFGPAGIDETKPERTTEAYVAKYYKKYRQRLDAVLNRPLDIDRSLEDRNLFFANYQFFRYLSHLNEKTQVYFVLPQANPLYDKSVNLIAQWLRPEFFGQVHVHGLESLLQTLLKEESFSDLKPICEDFRKKYLAV